MSIRLRCPNVSLTRDVNATVVHSSVPLLSEGDHVLFRTDEGRGDQGRFEYQHHTYRVGNIRFLGELSDERHLLIECELAD